MRNAQSIQRISVEIARRGFLFAKLNEVRSTFNEMLDLLAMRQAGEAAITNRIYFGKRQRHVIELSWIRMKKPDNVDNDREDRPRSDSSEAPTETNDSYYYDDSTGYEIFKDGDGDEEESELSEKNLDDRNN